jgi:hypothetical protein
VTAIGPFQKSGLAIFFSDNSQVWTVDSNPANNALVDNIEGIGTLYPPRRGPVSRDLFFLAQNGFRSVSLISITDNLQDNDVGSAIDALVKAQIVSTDDPMSLYYPKLGQFWCINGATVWVYTFSRTSKISAWSKYTLPFTIDDATVLNQELYVRTGNDVYRVSDTVYKDGVSSIPLVDVQMFYQDGKRPGCSSSSPASTSSAPGMWTISHLFARTTRRSSRRPTSCRRSPSRARCTRSSCWRRASRRTSRTRRTRRPRSIGDAALREARGGRVKKLTLELALALVPHLSARDRAEIGRTQADLERWARSRVRLPASPGRSSLRGEVQCDRRGDHARRRRHAVDRGPRRLGAPAREATRLRSSTRSRASAGYAGAGVQLLRGQRAAATLCRAAGLRSSAASKRDRSLRDGAMNLLKWILFPGALVCCAWATTVAAVARGSNTEAEEGARPRCESASTASTAIDEGEAHVRRRVDMLDPARAVARRSPVASRRARPGARLHRRGRDGPQTTRRPPRRKRWRARTRSSPTRRALLHRPARARLHEGRARDALQARAPRPARRQRGRLPAGRGEVRPRPRRHARRRGGAPRGGGPEDPARAGALSRSTWSTPAPATAR